MSDERPRTPALIGRRALIVGAAAMAAACATGGRQQGRATERPSTTPRPGRLTLQGVNYDTDRTVWRPRFVRREIEAIRTDLHCNSILLLGSELGRLTESASIAAEQGLYVWFEPRSFDKSPAHTLEFLDSVARAAEDLRSTHPDVGLSVGCELTIFLPGLVPGNSWSERGAALSRPESAGYNGRLNDFLGEALATVRPIFGGQVTYTSGTWEDVDWSDFDVVGVDLYRDADNEATYVEDVRSLHRHGKPVVITEFGCCTYRGASEKGGIGFDIVDYGGAEPVLVGNPVRDEQEQADYIEELLDVFEAEGVHGAFVYNFINPDDPYSPDPRHDLDMASFSVVKVHPSGSERAYDTTGSWEPKLSFHAIARRFS